MQWERLTSEELKRACADTRGVCVIPLGSIEPHGVHLPLGMDYRAAHGVAVRAAAIEPAVVFPPMALGSVYESMHMPGTIALKPDVLLALYQNLFLEIARNGFDKQILLNGHGGNSPFVGFLSFSRAYEKLPYTLYTAFWPDLAEPDEISEMDQDNQGRPVGHACEWETSAALALFPEDVKTERLPEGVCPAHDGLSELGRCHTGYHWFDQAPGCYLGDAHFASARRGERYLSVYAKNLARMIGAIKNDRAVARLKDEFHQKSGR